MFDCFFPFSVLLFCLLQSSFFRDYDEDEEIDGLYSSTVCVSNEPHLPTNKQKKRVELISELKDPF